jgi:hypothetical protein
MHIIYKPSINKKNQRTLFTLTLLLFASLTHAQECQAFKYQTPFTRCQISLDQCVSYPSMGQSTNSDIYYRFKNCQIEHCVTLGTGPDCHSYVTIELDEKDCYHSCCNSKDFVPQTCASSNVILQQKTEAANNVIAIGTSPLTQSSPPACCF